MVHIINVEPGDDVNGNKLGAAIGSVPVVVAFYMPECGYCKMLKEPWGAFTIAMEKQHPSDNAVIAFVHKDAEKYVRDVMVKNNKLLLIHGYPTIMGFKNDGNMIEFNKERSADKLMEFYHDVSGNNKSALHGMKTTRKTSKNITNRKKKGEKRKNTKKKINKKKKTKRRETMKKSFRRRRLLSGGGPKRGNTKKRKAKTASDMSTARNSNDKMKKMKKMKRTSSSSSTESTELGSTDRDDKIEQFFKERQKELDYRHDPKNISPIEPCHTDTDERYGNIYGKYPKKVSDWGNRHTKPPGINEFMYSQQPKTPLGFEHPRVSPVTTPPPDKRRMYYKTNWEL